MVTVRTVNKPFASYILLIQHPLLAMRLSLAATMFLVVGVLTSGIGSASTYGSASYGTVCTYSCSSPAGSSSSGGGSSPTTSSSSTKSTPSSTTGSSPTSNNTTTTPSSGTTSTPPTTNNQQTTNAAGPSADNAAPTGRSWTKIAITTISVLAIFIILWFLTRHHKGPRTPTSISTPTITPSSFGSPPTPLASHSTIQEPVPVYETVEAPMQPVFSEAAVAPSDFQSPPPPSID